MGNMQEIKDRLTALEDIVFDMFKDKPETVNEAEPKPKSKKKTKKKEGK